MAQIKELRRFKTVLDRINYKNWRFVLVDIAADRIALQIWFDSPCASTCEMKSQHSRKWLLSPWMTDSEIVMTAFKAVLTAEEHEAREAFRYRARAIFGPHFNVDLLASICDNARALDVRAPEAR